MLSGLEAAEIKFLEITSNKKERIDSEYFKKEFIANAATIRGCGVAVSCLVDRSRLRSVKALSVTKPFSYLEISRINLRGGDYGLISVEPENIPDRADKILRNGDVVVSTVRPNRNAAALIRNAKRLIATSGLAVLRARKIDPKYLFAYCKTRHFVVSLMRETTATMYPAVSRGDVFEVSFPFPSAAMQSGVCAIISKCFECLDASERQYQSAQQLLARELGIADFRPDESGIAIKSCGESFATTDRLDAEYYRPKYDSMLALISQFPCERLADIVSVVKSVEPGSNAYCDSGIPFVRVADLTKFGVTTTNKYLSLHEWAENLPLLRPKKDEVLLTKDGTIGIAYKVENDLDVVVSSAILRLRVPKKHAVLRLPARKNHAILPDYLVLVLNSPCVQMQAERDTGGSIIAHWLLDDVKNALIPILPPAKQRALADKARESFRLRSESNRLLAVAKRAVEIAIEKGEAEALRFIEKSRAN